MFEARAFALATVAVVALARAAAAADLLPPPPMEPPAPIVSPDLGGWYLRGDAGVSVSNQADISTSPDALATGVASGFYSGTATEGFFNPTMSESALLDVGVGYQVNSWFRADVTGELRGGATLQGLEILNDSNFPNNKTYNQVQYGDFYRANVSSYLLLFNAYADLGTWYGVTPFVGAGVGTSYNRIEGATDTGYASFANGTTGANASYATGGYFSNSSHVDLAWALMAGLDFNVTRNLKLELGYRFLDYGKVTSGASHCAAGANGAGAYFNCTPYTLATRELTANDFRVGLRYYLDAPAPAPEAPLVRRY